jgi:hypothetical protein
MSYTRSITDACTWRFAAFDIRLISHGAVFIKAWIAWNLDEAI